MFLSDNGSCPFDSNRDFDHPPGGAPSYRTLSAAWANLGNTPFRYYKQFGHEGGAHTHFIASWPAVIKDQGGLTDQPGHVIDMFPTILDITRIAYPSHANGRPTIPLEGSSLLPVFKGQERKEPEYLVSGFTERFRMYRRGDWKIVKANNEEWQLYNLENDLTETNDLSAVHPEKMQELVHAYAQWKENLPEKP
jgi:arylsulfatase